MDTRLADFQERQIGETSAYHGNPVGLTSAVFIFGVDALAFLAAFAIGGISAFAFSTYVLGTEYRQLLDENIIGRLVQYCAVALGLLGYFYGKGHYRQRIPFWEETKQITVALSLALLVDGFMQFAVKETFSRLWLGEAWMFSFIFVVSGRAFAKLLMSKIGIWQLPTIVIGSQTSTDHVVETLLSDKALGYEIVKTLDFSDVVAKHADNKRGIWEDLCERYKARFIILTIGESDIDRYRTLIENIVRNKIPFGVVSSMGGLPVLGLDLYHFFSSDVVLLVGRNNLAQPISRILKAIFDYFMVVILSVMFAPFILLISAIIYVDGGSVLYRHWRIGRSGKPFPCYKFRTMVVNSNEILSTHLKCHPNAAVEWAQNQKLRNDPRVTAIGKILRRFSLDELPQLLNVLQGDMSLVGPRPIVEEEIRFYQDNACYYFETKPGITGLWQVSGRSDVDYQRRVYLDTWYAKNWSLWTDIVILLKTIPILFRHSGAY